MSRYASHSILNLLDLPTELRMRIYDYVFLEPKIVKISNDHPDRVGEQATWSIFPVQLGAQMLRTCVQIHREASKSMYENKIFDCSQREGLKLLLNTIGSKKLSLIKHLILDWEQLQDFGWSLAKEEFRDATIGLKTIQLASWRLLVLGGSSTLWREVKSHERQLCQAALDICSKHDKLKIVAQQPYHRSSRSSINSQTLRIKWRFLALDEELYDDEVIINLEDNLTLLSLKIVAGESDIEYQTTANQ